MLGIFTMFDVRCISFYSSFLTGTQGRNRTTSITACVVYTATRFGSWALNRICWRGDGFVRSFE